MATINSVNRTIPQSVVPSLKSTDRIFSQADRQQRIQTLQGEASTIRKMIANNDEMISLHQNEIRLTEKMIANNDKIIAGCEKAIPIIERLIEIKKEEAKKNVLLTSSSPQEIATLTYQKTNNLIEIKQPELKKQKVTNVDLDKNNKVQKRTNFNDDSISSRIANIINRFRTETKMFDLMLSFLRKI